MYLLIGTVYPRQQCRWMNKDAIVLRRASAKKCVQSSSQRLRPPRRVKSAASRGAGLLVRRPSRQRLRGPSRLRSCATRTTTCQTTRTFRSSRASRPPIRSLQTGRPSRSRAAQSRLPWCSRTSSTLYTSWAFLNSTRASPRTRVHHARIQYQQMLFYCIFYYYYYTY